MKPRRRNHGFTLTELMISIAIIGVLIAMIMVMINPTPTPRDVSQRVADLVREGSREAVNFGPVRPNVLAANATLTKARACVVGGVDGTGATTFTLQLLQEAATVTQTTYSWTSQSTFTVPKTISSVAYAASVGNYAGVTPLTSWASFKLCCYADGTCDPYTAFFQNTRASGGVNYQARVSVLPIGAQPIIRSDFTSL